MKRILIIDDEPNVRLNFRLTLEIEGYEVMEAANGTAARELLLGELFDLAILDVRMPGMDGLALLEQMREEGISTPVIIVTAYGSVPDAVRAMKLGAIDFLEKPLRPADLRRLVAEVVERHQGDLRDRTESDNFPTHLRAAKRQINLRNFTLTEKHLHRALEFSPHSADALNLLGVLAELRDDYRTARKYYGRAIRAKHDHEAAQQNMRRLFELNLFGATDEPLNLGD